MVFLRAAAARPDRIHTTFRAVRDGRVTLCLGTDLLTEVRDVLNRDAVRAKFPSLTVEAVEVFIASVLAQGKMFDSVPQAFNWPEHPDDNHLFDLGIYAKAKYLVT